RKPARRGLPPHMHKERIIYGDGSCIHNGSENATAETEIWEDSENGIQESKRITGNPLGIQREELGGAILAMLRVPKNNELTYMTD
ncbi:uncharacterized protein BT62DRAFT_821286, partial [Guyanagaster necrorhizus]